MIPSTPLQHRDGQDLFSSSAARLPYLLYYRIYIYNAIGLLKERQQQRARGRKKYNAADFEMIDHLINKRNRSFYICEVNPKSRLTNVRTRKQNGRKNGEKGPSSIR